MADQRTPADKQDYSNSINEQLRIAFGLQLAHSQEAYEIGALLALIANLVVQLDDGPTDNLVIQNAYEIARGDKPQVNPKPLTMGELEQMHPQDFRNPE